MKTNDIRKKFLEFFKSKDHTVVNSDSLVPKDDPTVLFTTAGMQQFKRQFMGHIEDYSRAATSQKCLRTDDLEEVGQTNFHHTFFEMLGNFSFGDYFKKEAIAWAWEFFTEVCQIPEEKLWVSVYKDDTEAFDIWTKDIGIDPKKIVKLGDKDNFWPANAKENGPNGPCGPCSEIFFDYGENKECTSQPCDPSCSCGRFAEVWNLVFTQFNRKDGGILEPLPSQNIDTGMGLERLAAVLQGKANNFETDVFEPILKSITKNVEDKNVKLTRKERYVIADHVRAISFAITDGIIPSNKERGFVIKNLINSGANIPLSHGKKEPSIYKLVSGVVEAMQEPYPEIKAKQKDIEELVKKTEEAFISVRNKRIPELEKKLSNVSDEKVIGELWFTYRDTYGLPLQTIVEVSRTCNVAVSDESRDRILAHFNEFMERQKDQSRKFSKMTGDVFADSDVKLDVEKTKFIGYDHTQSASKILKILTDQGTVSQVSAGQNVKIVLDQTPFYAESGGQVGDTGALVKKNARIVIQDTQKKDDIYFHYGHVEEGGFKEGDSVEAEIDSQRRISIMRNHTATHLLQAALRSVLGEHVQQQGSLVANDRLRFDFTHHKAISDKEIAAIEEHVNRLILENETVDKEFLDIEQARKKGALAFFAEKYGKVVRVVSIGESSKEFCGGTHLDATGQIGLLKIVGESAIAQGIRRIEAKTGTGALDYIKDQEKTLNAIASALKAPVNECVGRVKSQAQRIKELEKELDKFGLESVKSSIDSYVKQSKEVNGVPLIHTTLENADINLLRKTSDMIKQKCKSAVIVLGAKRPDNASILVVVTDDLVKKGWKAGSLVKEFATLINGSGGGRPNMAQAGSKDPSKVDGAVAAAQRIVGDYKPE